MSDIDDFLPVIKLLVKDYDLTISIITTVAPFQAVGRIGEKYYYFRSRGSASYFGVADTGDNAILEKTAEFCRYAAGDSWLEPDEFHVLMRAGLDEYLAWRELPL